MSAPSLTSASITRQVFAAYEVQVLSPGPAAAIVALGDSITEGACSEHGRERRLARPAGGAATLSR